MNRIKKWWKSRLKNIYIIREVDANDEVVTEYYFKKRKNRDVVHGQLLILDSSEHYSAWCELRNYKPGPESWMEYIDTVGVIDKYIIIDAKVCANDIRLNAFSFEETVKRELNNK